MSASLIVLAVLVAFVVLVIARTIRIVPQQNAQVIERLGSYNRTLSDGLHVLVPFLDRVRASVDLREQVVTFPPQPVITSDNLVVSIDTVIYYSVTDSKAATYEIENYITGIEQLTVTTLRNVIGSLDLEKTLTSRDEINAQLRGVLDETTGRWGIRVNRVELKSINPPASVQDSMEKQMRAERDRRAAILTAEGLKQSAILQAEGEQQSLLLTAESAKKAAIMKAEGEAQSTLLRAEADAKAIAQRAEGEASAVRARFAAIHDGEATPDVLAYTYLEALPKIAEGDASKMWIIPSEVTGALSTLSDAFGTKDES